MAALDDDKFKDAVEDLGKMEAERSEVCKSRKGMQGILLYQVIEHESLPRSK